MLKFLFVIVVTLFTSQVFADPNGVYEGIISMSPARGFPGRNVPITIALEQTKSEMPPSNSSSVFASEKAVAGSFVLDSEVGPYPFSSSEYDPDTGMLILKYGRIGTSTGSPSTIANLILECKRLVDGTCNGVVTSGLGNKIGTIALKQNPNASTSLIAIPKYVGKWHGTITYTADEMARRSQTFPGDPDPATEDFDLNLDDGGTMISNPDTYEIASSPQRVGFDYEGGLVNRFAAVPFSTVYIDYLRGIAKLTGPSVSSGGTAAAEVLTLNFKEDDLSIVGTMVTPYGLSGTIVAKKVQ